MKPWGFFNRHRNPGKQRLLINQHKITWLACDKSLFVVKEKKQGNQWCLFLYVNKSLRRSRSKVFLGKAVLKICSKFTGEHPCRSAISIKLQSKFIEITLRHGCSPVKLLYVFRRPFPKNTFGQLLLVKDGYSTVLARIADTQ